jgi:hypothetical protein
MTNRPFPAREAIRLAQVMIRVLISLTDRSDEAGKLS